MYLQKRTFFHPNEWSIVTNDNNLCLLAGVKVQQIKVHAFAAGLIAPQRKDSVFMAGDITKDYCFLFMAEAKIRKLQIIIWW